MKMCRAFVWIALEFAGEVYASVGFEGLMVTCLDLYLGYVIYA